MQVDSMNQNTSEESVSAFLIDSLNHPKAVTIRQLLTREGRIRLNQIIIDDEENIIQAIHSGIEVLSVYYVEDRDSLSGILKVLSNETEVVEVAKRTAKKLFSNDRLSRIFAIARRPEPLKLSDLSQINKDVVVLEDLSISGNIGSIIRTSLGLDCGALVLLNMEPHDIYDRRLIRASRGYVFSLPVITAKTEDMIEYCRKNNEKITVSSIEGNVSVEDISSEPGRLILVFGSEKTGTTENIENAAELKFKIPLKSEVESLNVSVAAAITLFSRREFNRTIEPDTLYQAGK